MTARSYHCKRCNTDLGSPPPYPKSAPVWDRYWDGDSEESVLGWREFYFCDEHAAEAMGKAKLQRLEDFIGSSNRMRYWSLDTFPADDPAGKAAKAAAQEWIGDWDRNLFLFGPVGSGKTGLAFAAARCIAEKGWEDVRFCNVRQVLAELRRSYETKTADDPTKALVACDLLVLDDLGAERATEWARETIATLVEARYVDGYRPTIVTTNYTPSDLAKRLGHDDPVIGQRIVSRLTEGAEQIRLDRADLRQRAA